MANQLSETKSDQKLNRIFVVILWINIFFTSVATFELIDKFTSNNDTVVLLNALLSACAVVGAFLLIKANKKGFYIIVAVNVIMGFLAFYQYTQTSVDEYGILHESAKSGAVKGVLGCLGQIVVLMLLMLLKKDGKNAYQVLWGESKNRTDSQESCVPHQNSDSGPSLDTDSDNEVGLN